MALGSLGDALPLIQSTLACLLEFNSPRPGRESSASVDLLLYPLLSPKEQFGVREQKSELTMGIQAPKIPGNMGPNTKAQRRKARHFLNAF